MWMYELQTGPMWNHVLSLLAWVYMFLTFFETTGLEEERLSDLNY
jgi:hypothetical protein